MTETTTEVTTETETTTVDSIRGIVAEDLAEDLLAAGLSPEHVARLCDLPLGDSDDHGDLVIVDGAWYADDGHAEVRTSGDSAREACVEYVADGDWNADGATVHIDVHGYRYGLVLGYDEETVVRVMCDREGHTITVEPDAPECDDGHAEHSWISPIEAVGGLEENPGVRASGGGVVVHEVCEHCGCGRVTDTWAQHGGEQGYTTVEYTAAQYARCEEHGWHEDGDCQRCEVQS